VKAATPNQFVRRTDVALFGQDACRGFGHVAQIDEADPRADRIGHAKEPILDDGAPARQDVLHVSGRLENRHREAGCQQHLLDPKLCPVVRHRLDLRMQHGVIDEARNAGRLSRGDHGAGVGNLMRADIRADVIDRAGPFRGRSKRGGILEYADCDFAGALCGDLGRSIGAMNQSTRRRATRGQRRDDRHSSLSGCSGDEDHRDFVAICQSRAGLSGISRISMPFDPRSSASSIACANSGPTGMAPASPAPLMPSGLSGDFVTVRELHVRHVGRGRQ
jgi:hypothetical protein